MKKKIYSFLLTALLGMTGMNAWAQDYEITCAQDLADFAAAVNGGEFTANAVLTEDIDMSELSEWTAIGDWTTGSGANACYKGHFDGQGHTIKNFNFTSTHNYFGVFGVISTGALIENFDIYGTMKLDHKTGGVVGYSRDATPTIRNIKSDMKIVCSGVTSAQRPGGIVGSAVNGTTVIENCSYSGYLDAGGRTGNIGGIVGYVNNNAAAIVNITNCLFDGEIQNGTTADGQCGGIIGYNNSGTVTIKNCLSIGTIVASSGNDGMFIGRLNGSNTTFTNNYYVGDNVNGTSSGKSAKGTAPVEVTDAQLASGEIAFKLNESVSGGENWFQKVKNTVFAAQQYTITVNGTPREPQTANATLVENGGTYTFTLPNFSVNTNFYTLEAGTVSLDGVIIDPDGTFTKTGQFSVPDENIPSLLLSKKDKLQNVNYTLNGKVNGDKLYATIDGIDIDLGSPYGEYVVSVEIGTDDFTAAAPTCDEYPTPYGTDKVYANGSFNCDGVTPKEGSSIIYSNADNSIIDSHNFADGLCTVCGTVDENYMAANADGFFEIGTPAQLKWFATYVNTKDVAANAILVADIALTDDWTTPIGGGSGSSTGPTTAYNGTFDGQGHSITGFNIESNARAALFGDVTGATIKNFSISGTITVTGGYGAGVVGFPTSSTIENIHSALVIDVPNSGAHHVGGVVGSARGNNTISGCTFTGSLTVAAGSTDNFAGIVGYITNGDKVINCANYGDVTFKDAGCAAGGIVGYVNAQQAAIQNCLSTGKITFDGEGTPTYGAAIIGRTKGFSTDLVKNNYWLEGTAYGTIHNNDGSEAMTTGSVTAEQLASGEVAFLLGTAWGQEIGVDTTPVLGGPTVVAWGDTYGNPNIETAAGDAECILPSIKWGGSYSAYTTVFQGDFDYGDWNTSNPNYNVLIGTPAEEGGKAWYEAGYSVAGWNYGQDLPEFGDGRPADVYAVRYFTVDGEIPSTLYMPAPHDDAPCEYYINGVQVFAETDGWFEDEVVRLTDAQKALIKTDGTVNVFAFHVHQNWGGRYADGGLYTAGAPVDAFIWDDNKRAIDATIAIMEAQSIGAEEIEYANSINYRNGFTKGLAQLRKARRLVADARTENFTGSEPADGMIAYIYNVGAKMFLAGGNDWGTHASLNHMGAKCVLRANSSGANRYSIQTNLPNGLRNANDGLGHNGYVDCGYGADFTTSEGWAWTFEALADGTYHIINSSNSGDNIYLGMTEDDRLQIDTDKADADNPFNKWLLVTPEEFEALAEQATESNPVDLGHLIHQATFSQNDFDGNDKGAANDDLNDSKWERNAGGIWNWKGNSSGGDYMFEMWNTKDVNGGYVWLVQELEGLPAGNYTVQMSGYYRDGNFERTDEGNLRQLAYLFAGTEENCVPLVNIVSGSGNCPGIGRGGSSGIVIPDGCYEAAKFFQVGTYINTIDAVVGADGKLKIGVYRNAGNDILEGDWIVTDNWRLYYKGNPVEVTITDAGYATFVAPGNVKTIPSEVEAFAVQKVDGKDFVHLEAVTAIPAGEAVVLKAAEGTYTINASAFTAELGTDNDLKVSSEAITANGSQFVLADDAHGVGFYKATVGTTIAAGKGYLEFTNDVKAFYPFFEDDATGIKDLNDSKDSKVYNLAGQRMSKMQKGINIIAGKKVLY